LEQNMNVILIVAATAGLMLTFEHYNPARRYSTSGNWWFRAAMLNGAQVATAFLGALTWDIWLTGASPIVAIEGPDTLRILAGYLLITFVYYWWHRARHESSFLWRWLHRTHHSPQRLEVITSFYKHPFELIANGILSSFLLTVALGLSPENIAAVVLITGLAELVYHWNVRTPYGMGWLFQRPEMHRVHHQQGVHDSNFSDLPLWDILFGTFENPQDDECACGFPEEHKLGRILLGAPVVETPLLETKVEEL
jgi:sterol desaturase/sphingolipid hydroxylase (fatty acid hydroxylase superfamily)